MTLAKILRITKKTFWNQSHGLRKRVDWNYGQTLNKNALILMSAVLIIIHVKNLAPYAHY